MASTDWYSRTVQTVMAAALVLILVELRSTRDMAQLPARPVSGAAAPAIRLVSGEAAGTGRQPQADNVLNVRIVGFRRARFSSITGQTDYYDTDFEDHTPGLPVTSVAK